MFPECNPGTGKQHTSCGCRTTRSRKRVGRAAYDYDVGKKHFVAAALMVAKTK